MVKQRARSDRTGPTIVRFATLMDQWAEVKQTKPDKPTRPIAT